jgi:hypothetical protein
MTVKLKLWIWCLPLIAWFRAVLASWDRRLQKLEGAPDAVFRAIAYEAVEVAASEDDHVYVLDVSAMANGAPIFGPPVRC